MRLRNSSELFLKTKEIVRHAPIEANSIQLNLSEDANSYIVLKLRNRFSMWMWTKWICLLYEVWIGNGNNLLLLLLLYSMIIIKPNFDDYFVYYYYYYY